MSDKCVQEIRSQHKTEQIKTAEYGDEMGNDVLDLIESDKNS